MRDSNADGNFPGWTGWRLHCLRGALSLVACIAATSRIHAYGVASPAARAAEHAQAAKPLAITKVPQVYLYGVIDADAPQRFEALVRSGKIPSGSDIYLNSSSGDLRAGLALGRLFHAGSMVTHLGTPRCSLRSGYASKTAFCVDACTYAYFGGLYRWAPTGFDRIGPSPRSTMDPKAGDMGRAQQAPDDIAEIGTEAEVSPRFHAATAT